MNKKIRTTWTNQTIHNPPWNQIMATGNGYLYALSWSYRSRDLELNVNLVRLYY